MRSIVAFDDGSGPALYAGGSFTTAGGSAINRVARWDGSSWTPVGTGTDGVVIALAVFDDGSGPALYAGGVFTTAGEWEGVNNIARWDGAEWSPLGSGVGGAQPWVEALAVFDDGGGPALYAAGRFTTAGGEPANRVARWDGAAWSPVGSGMDTWISALTVFDDGSGSALYAGGRFATAGGQPANRIAKWNGVSWSPLGAGVSADGFPGTVYGIAGFDDGSGPKLHVGGSFTHAGGEPANDIARWDGSSWAPIEPGLHCCTVRPLMVFDDGAGEAHYVGGYYRTASGPLVEHIGKWDGSAWSAMASSVDAQVWALGAFDNGAGPALYAGGAFINSGPTTVNHIARWSCPPAACYADCDGSGALDFFDFLCFQNLFAAADPAADCDASGELDFFDFLCFQNAFAAGCP